MTTRPKVLLVCHAGSRVGIGHLSRLLSLAQVIKTGGVLQPEFLIFGEGVKREELSGFDHQFLPINEGFEKSVKSKVLTGNPQVIVFDLYQQYHYSNFARLFEWLHDLGVFIVGIDSLLDYCNLIDFIWIPSFSFDPASAPACNGKLKSGWDCFLIQKRLASRVWEPGERVLILTGGCDVACLGKTLPQQLERRLPKEIQIDWVQGPYSEAPHIPEDNRSRWHVHIAPKQLDELIVQSNYVLTVFGVSLFEVLQYGIPTVVFSPYGEKDSQELGALEKEGVAVVCHNSDSAVEGLVDLLDDDDLALSCSEKSLQKMTKNGAQQLADVIYSAIGV